MIELDFYKTLNGVNGSFTLSLKAKIDSHSRVAIFGKSGAGKSTILKVIAGLERIEGGTLRVGGEIWDDGKRFFPIQNRGVGFVFQNYSLFPNLSVYENISYGKNASPAKIHSLLEMMEFIKLKDTKPSELSGGQAQRVAIARALANSPKILLLDEPFSALDHTIKSKLLLEVLLLQKEFGFTLVFVSHDIAEVYALAQRVWMLEDGKLLSSTTPKETFEKNNLKLIAQILEIKHNELVCEVCVLLGGEVMSFVVHPDEIEGMREGESVEIILKSFSPILRKIDSLS